MITRFITAILLISLFIGILKLGHPFTFFLMIMISLICSFELGKILFQQKKHRVITLIIHLLSMILVYNFPEIWNLSLIFVFIAISWIWFGFEIFQPTISKRIFMNYYRSIVLISFSFPYALLLLEMSNAIFLIGTLCCVVWSTDTFSLIVGRYFGKHKLCAASPNKTIEGSIGGIIGGTMTTLLILLMINKASLFLCLTVFILSIFIQIGDLYESRLKRMANIKDSSNILPGHGGLLDRSDSFLIALPLYFFLITTLIL